MKELFTKAFLSANLFPETSWKFYLNLKNLYIIIDKYFGQIFLNSLLLKIIVSYLS